MLKQKKLIAFVPGMISEQGHFFRYNLAIEKVAKLLNMSFSSIVGKYCSIEKLPHTWSKQFYSGRNKYLKALNRLYIYCRCFQKKELFSSVFFLDSFSLIELSLVFIAASVFLKSNDRLALVFRYDLEFCSHKRILKHLVRFVNIIKKNKIFFFSDSHLIKIQYEKLLKTPIIQLPIPHTGNRIFYSKHQPTIALWWPGSPRENKGLQDILSLIRSFSPLNQPFSLYLSEEVRSLCPHSNLKIYFLSTILDEDTYEAMFSKTSLVLLPYKKINYKRQTSGIFVESICYGSIPVTYTDTWMAGELERFDLSELIVNFNDRDIWERLAHISQSEVIRKKVDCMRENYLNYHNVPSFAKEFSRALF